MGIFFTAISVVARFAALNSFDSTKIVVLNRLQLIMEDNMPECNVVNCFPKVNKSSAEDRVFEISCLKRLSQTLTFQNSSHAESEQTSCSIQLKSNLASPWKNKASIVDNSSSLHVGHSLKLGHEPYKQAIH